MRNSLTIRGLVVAMLAIVLPMASCEIDHTGDTPKPEPKGVRIETGPGGTDTNPRTDQDIDVDTPVKGDS